MDKMYDFTQKPKKLKAFQLFLFIHLENATSNYKKK